MITHDQHPSEQPDAPANPDSKGPGAAGNARKHGLTASKHFCEDEKAMIAARQAELEKVLHPEGIEQQGEVLAIAMASVRLERCRVEEEAHRLRRAERAEFYWDADLWEEVMKLVQGLPKRPELIVAKLKQRLRGCMWLLKEWRDLAGRVGETPAGGSPRPLDETGRRRAADLLGLSAEARVGPCLLDLPCGAGSEAEVAAHQRTLIAAQIAALEPLTSAARVALDESIRIDTMNGVNLTVDDATRLIRRYESEARRVKERAYQNLKTLQDRAKAVKQAEREEWRPFVEKTLNNWSGRQMPRVDIAGAPSATGSEGPAEPGVKAEPAGPAVTVQAGPAEAGSEESRTVAEPDTLTAAPAPRPLTRRARKVLAARAAKAAKAAPRTPR
jgi:hypothetical protein